MLLYFTLVCARCSMSHCVVHSATSYQDLYTILCLRCMVLYDLYIHSDVSCVVWCCMICIYTVMYLTLHGAV
jgi:hypothetical protein